MKKILKGNVPAHNHLSAENRRVGRKINKHAGQARAGVSKTAKKILYPEQEWQRERGGLSPGPVEEKEEAPDETGVREKKRSAHRTEKDVHS